MSTVAEKAKKNDAIVRFPQGKESDPRMPLVDQQRGSKVTVLHGEHLKLGTWLRLGNHAGMVVQHEKGRAIVEVFFETDGENWFEFEHGVRHGSQVTVLLKSDWEDLLRGQFPRGVKVGRVNQEIEITEGVLPSPDDQVRLIVAGQAGSGKSSALNSYLVAWRNQISPTAIRRPGLIVFDFHGDFLGRVRDKDGNPRPSLYTCLREEAVVFGINSLFCKVSDLPADIYPKTVELTAVQKRWVNIYCSGEKDHENLQYLLFSSYQPEWFTHFRELAGQDEKIPQPVVDSLVALRSKLISVIGIGEGVKDSLFRKNGESTWRKFVDLIRAGRTIIIDMAEFREVQRALLLVLVIENLIKEQKDFQRSGDVLQPIVIAADEAHALASGEKSLIKASLEGRKFGLNLILGSQSIGHYCKDVVDQATHGIILKTQGTDLDMIGKRWPESKKVLLKLRNQSPGQGFLVGGGVPWPIQFIDPVMVRPPYKNLK